MAPLALLLILCALVYLASAAWRTADAVLRGLPGGLRLFWWLARPLLLATLKGLRLALHWADVGGLELARRAHAAWWVYSYCWRRQYVARHIRGQRKRALHL
jgi:hypothetical protein